MKKVLMALLALSGGALLASAAGHDDKEAKGKKHAGPTRAIAVMHPTKGSSVTGVVAFTQKAGYVEVKGVIKGLTPGLHGFHVHQWGDCSDPAAMSAGGHFDPDGMPHGGPEDKKRHVGDLGNIKADENGDAVIEIQDKLLALSGEHSIIGRSLIVHAKADDLKSQPSGDAGGRVACGVIGVAAPLDSMKKDVKK